MTLDLSAVTDTLIGMVKSQWNTAPIWSEVGGSPPGPTFTPNFTGLAPDAAMKQNGAQLSMYLYHVESDNAREALFWQPQMFSGAGEPTTYLPLALNLFYLLFAYSETSYTEEQEAMSVALRIYHDNPIVRSDPGVTPAWELTLTMEHRSYDELSRLWQATTAPLRMSLVFRAAVVFIEPDPMPTPAPTPSVLNIGLGIAELPIPAKAPMLVGTYRAGTYAGPAGPPVEFSRAPATVAASQTLWLDGSNLGTAGISDSVYLLPPGGAAEVPVTAWTSAGDSTGSRFVLTLPATVGPLASLPGDAPPAGSYQLTVGSGAMGSPGAVRSNPTQVAVAAWVDPAGGPVLSGGVPYTVGGQGFVGGATEVYLGTTALVETGGSPSAGQFAVDPTGTSLTFAPAAGPAGEVVALRVVVNGIESDPALWVTL